MHVETRCSATRRTVALNGQALLEMVVFAASSAHPPRSGPVDVPGAACALDWRHIELTLAFVATPEQFNPTASAIGIPFTHPHNTSTMGCAVLRLSVATRQTHRTRDLRDMIIMWSTTLRGLSLSEDECPRQPPTLPAVSLIGSSWERDKNRAPTTSGEAMGMGTMVGLEVSKWC